MAEIVDAESGTGVEKTSNGQHSQSGEALAEWRSSDQVENGTPSTAPIYWDTDDDEDDDDDFGPKPSELYGKHTWKIDKFSEINKRELRSSAFEVGGYQWYILIYPQGCDVCNHLSLFLCVANHDKLLPGWSHFAQFTIAVVNKDPKKSKYSDTLHRFWKKEHDWGWKKFMELPKLKDGFIDDSDSLTIKAQVQVIRERADRPFRCLDSQYRRELVRVYLTNVEQICRRFVEERRSKLGRLLEDKARWSSFGAFWLGMDQSSRRKMSREKMDVILKVAVKHFFIEKEVTSTLVMDSLYSGLKALEGLAKIKKSRPKSLGAEEMSAPIVSVDKDMFVLVDDVILLLQRAATEPLPPKDDKGPQNRTKDGNTGEDFNKELILRDERHLTELGRRTVEIFVLAHIFSNKIEVAYQEAIALKRQEELIREEEAAWLAESELKAKRGAEKEKKSKKKQAKQKRNKSKAKEKREEKTTSVTQERPDEENQCNEPKDTVAENAEPVHDNPETLEDVLYVSDSLDGSAEIQADSEDREGSPVNWDTDTSEVHNHPTEGCSSGANGLSSVPNGVPGKKSRSVVDDSSSTCSNDSVPSVVNNGSHKGNSSYHHNQKSPSIVKNSRSKGTCDMSSVTSETAHRLSSLTLGVDAKSQSNVSESRKPSKPEVVVVNSTLKDSKKLPGNPAVKKVGNSLQKKPDMENSNSERPKETIRAPSSPLSRPKNASAAVQAKSDSRTVPNAVDTISTRKTSLNSPRPSDQAPSSTLGAPSLTVGLKPTDKLPTKPTPVISRPSSAPLIHSSRSAVPAVSMVQTTSLLARSVSSTGWSGPDLAPPAQNLVPQSYRNAILGNHVGSSGFSYSSLPSQSAGYGQSPSISASFQPSLSIGVTNQDVLPSGTQWTGNWGSRSLNHGIRNVNQYLSSGSDDKMGFGDISAQGLLADEFPHLDIINDLLEDENASNAVTSGNLFHAPQLLNTQYASLLGTDRGMSSGEMLPSMFDRSMSYHEERVQQGYSRYEPIADLSQHASSYGNQLSEGFVPSQWQSPPLDLSMWASMRNPDAERFRYYEPRNPNLPGSINGYAEFRPSSGH